MQNFTPPQKGEIGFGLNKDAMMLLKQYGIDNQSLFRYDDPNSHFKEIYQALQEAKKGNNIPLKEALESRFGKNKWFQKVL